ncbi:hypothetical protein NFI96_022156, partial [Prochilodus magdalenae]
VLFSRISGVEVETRVRPGDNALLYSDCAWESGEAVWFRNSSHENQTPLFISGETLRTADFSRYCFVWNQVNQTKDLLVKNVSESDLGLYYCAVRKKSSFEDETGAVVRRDVYHYGNLTTRLSLLGKVTHSDLWVLLVNNDVYNIVITCEKKDSEGQSENQENQKRTKCSECGWCAAGVLFSRISGAEVEMRVRPGDNAVLYCDCVWKREINIVWFRKSSNEDQPPLVISAETLIQDSLSRLAFVWNYSNQTQDLLVRNVSESDLGLYYCAVQQIKFIKDRTGAEVRRDVNRYGNRTTRLSLL